MAKMDTENAKLIISNLPGEFTTELLFDHFGSFGEVTECEFKWGIGFVGFGDPEAAEAAYTGMNETKVEGNKIKIDFPGRKTPVSRLIVKNLPTADYSSEELKELFEVHGAIVECEYKWGYGFIKFNEENSVTEACKALKGTEVTPGRKLYFELQGPNGEASKKAEVGAASNHHEDEVSDNTHAKIGPVRLFIGNLADGTTEEEVREVVEPLGDVKKVDVKGNFAFVHFKGPDACRQALSVLSKKTINGKSPRVQLAEIKKGGKVFVGNLKEDQDQEELIEAFLALGSVVEYKFVRKFAFFTYDDPAEAKHAVSTMNGSDLNGTKIKVQISTADRAITGGDPDACHSCGMHGHIARYCPLDRKDNCHKCGGIGHWAKECPGIGAGGMPGGANGGRVRSRSPRRRSPMGEDYSNYNTRAPTGYPDIYNRGRR